MPTNHDETLQQRYARDHQDYLRTCGSMTAEQVADLQLQLNNTLAGEAVLREELEEAKRQLTLRDEGPLCWTCGDQGHVHSIDGELRGTCDNCGAYELMCTKHSLAATLQLDVIWFANMQYVTVERRGFGENIGWVDDAGRAGALRRAITVVAAQIGRTMP